MCLLQDDRIWTVETPREVLQRDRDNQGEHLEYGPVYGPVYGTVSELVGSVSGGDGWYHACLAGRKGGRGGEREGANR